ncbi:MAG: glycosyltransferase family 39 protein [Nitrosarchaeum sp.]|nr:glycosyltransferase family 39 protein [Nitrosarchaeum sp.]
MKIKFAILIPLALASFVHLANPVGFPDIFFDEGVYMRRAMNMVETGSPQEGYLYDHPYFGQIVLAGILHVTGHPNSTSTDPESLQNLYLTPRLFMGLVAIVSTFLVYHIAREKFGDSAALVSSVLFAVMPFTWIFGRILLDSILMPFLLASILCAIHFAKPHGKMWLVPVSGILLGLAIFTKVPAFVFIPLVMWLVFQKRRKIQDLLIWIMPVLLIPMLWPANAIMLDQFDLWVRDVMWQSQRNNSIGDIVGAFLIIDPTLFVIGTAGVLYSAIKKNKFVLLWFAPFVAFLFMVGFKQYFHWIPVIPVLCMGAAVLLLDLKKLRYFKSNTTHRGIIASVMVFGFASTVLIVTNDVSYNQFDALSYVIENHDGQSTILASPAYTWILNDVFDLDDVPIDYAMILFEPVRTESVTIIADPHFMLDRDRGVQMQKAYNNTQSVSYFEGIVDRYDTQIYPYTNLRLVNEGFNIDVRSGPWK